MWDGSVRAVQVGTEDVDTMGSMLRWLKLLLYSRKRAQGSGIEVAHSLMRPTVPPGRRRMTTTVEEFEKHVARQQAERDGRR